MKALTASTARQNTVRACLLQSERMSGDADPTAAYRFTSQTSNVLTTDLEEMTGKENFGQTEISEEIAHNVKK